MDLSLFCPSLNHICALIDRSPLDSDHLAIAATNVAPFASILLSQIDVRVILLFQSAPLLSCFQVHKSY